MKNTNDIQNNNTQNDIQNESNDKVSNALVSPPETRGESLMSQQVSRRGLLGIVGQGALGFAALALFQGNGSSAFAGSGRTKLERMMPGARELKGVKAGQPMPGMKSLLADTPLLSYIPTLTMWGDGQNFDQPEYYETLCVGDVDGDGQDELIIRGPAGILVERFDPPTGQWVTLTTATPLFSDAAGWNDPRYYKTIQCADVDYDNYDEIIGRGPNGIVAYKYSSDTNKFTLLEGGPGPCSDTDAGGIWTQEAHYSTLKWGKNPGGNGLHYMIGRYADGLRTWYYAAEVPGWYYTSDNKGPWKDTGPDGTNWTLPQYYETIQFADVDGDGRDELIGRSASGIEVYKFEGGNNDNNFKPYVAANGTLSDAAGWNKPEYYSTIQFADIDGDGVQELVARGAGVIVAFKLNTTTMQFEQLANGPGWSDASGVWNQAPYYSSIMFGDIDGDGADEMIGRDQAGIQIIKYYPNYLGIFGQVWQPILYSGMRSPAWTDDGTGADANGTKWNEVQYYSTLRLVRTHADDASRLLCNINTIPANDRYGEPNAGPFAALIARDRFGIQTWRYQSYPPDQEYGGMQGYFARTAAPTPDFTSTNANPLLAAAYAALDKTLRSTGHTGNFRDIYDDDIAKMNGVDGFMAKLYDSPTDIYTRNQTCKIPAPAGVDNTAWQTVTWQIYWEMSYVVSVHTWFASASNFLNTIAIAKGGIISTIGGYMSVPEDSKTSLAMSILSLFFNAAWAILGFPGLAEAGSAFSETPGQLSALSGMLATVFSAGTLGGDDSSWQGVYATLEAALVNAFSETSVALGNLNLAITGGAITKGYYVPMNYSLLAAIGQQINAAGTYSPWSWPSNIAPVAVAAERTYTSQAWGAILPASGWCLAYMQNGKPDHLVYTYNFPNDNNNPYWIANGSSTIADHQDLIFKQPSDLSDIFPLDIPLSDVFEGKNGWPVMKKVDYDTFSPPVGATQAAVPSTGVDLHLKAILTRNPTTGAIEAELELINRGLGGATNVEIVAAQLGSRPAIDPLPHDRTRLAAGKEWKAKMKFPTNAAQSGQTVILRIKGQHKTGTFGGSYRIKMP